MANAFCIQNAAGLAEEDNTQLVLVFDIILTGADVPGGRLQTSCRVLFAPNDIVNTIRTKATTAIQAAATSVGVTNLPATNITMPAYSKG